MISLIKNIKKGLYNMDRDQIITGVFYYDNNLKNENDIKNLKDCNAGSVVATCAEK